MPKKRTESRIQAGDWVLWCLAGALAIVLLFKHDTIAWTVGLLALLWLFLLIPALQLKAVKDAGPGWSKRLSVAIAILFVTVGVVSFGFNVWPESGLGILSEKERQRFISTLKTQQDLVPVHLMCPPNDEIDCARGAQFIRIFGLAGWPLATQVIDRVIPGQPKSGVYFVLHSTADVDYSKPEFQKPGVGVWTEMPNAYFTAKRAFENIGIKPDLEAGTSFPEHTLGIYFGVGTARP
jgi:hypothetical protein